MFINNAQTCPWVSIIPQDVMQNITKEDQVIALVKLFVKVTQQTLDICEKGQFADLDALVGNYGCETHTFNLLSAVNSKEIQEECKTLRETCKKIMECIENRRLIKGKKNLNAFKSEIFNMCSISERMKYLIQSRLLTITKTTSYDVTKYGTAGYEILKTVPSNLAKISKLGSKTENLLNTIVPLTQSCMSESSIIFMRKRLNELLIAQGDEGQLVKDMMSENNICRYASKAYSCCYYNSKALLMLMAELKSPLIIKKMGKIGDPVETHAFKSTGALGQFEQLSQKEIDNYPSSTPAVVCAAYLPNDWLERVQKYGLGYFILATGAEGPQYVPSQKNLFPIPLKEAELEISNQIKNAQGLDDICIDHFYAAGFGSGHRGKI